MDMDDPTIPEEFLHPCCQKEKKAERIKKRVMGKLTEADRTRIALERRRNIIKSAALVPPAHVHNVSS